MEEITSDRLHRIYKNLTDLSEATELRIFDDKLTKISNLQLIPRIKSLNLSYNQIPEIEGLKHCPELRDVNLSHNKITSVSSFAFEKNKQITNLDLSHNQIEKFAATSIFAKLQILNLEYNMLTSIEFIGNCKELRILNLSHNRIKRIDPVDYLIKLEELYVNHNQIGEISERNLKNNPNITHVGISYNQLKSINFAQNLPNLTSFECSHNKVKKIDFTRELTYLENLDLSYNELTSLIELTKFTPSLVTLDFSSNPNLDAFDLELLIELKDLREIDFSDNFFASPGFMEDLHQQFPHIETINGKQFRRPGYIELFELEKMKEDPELSSLDGDVSDPSTLVTADDKYDLVAVRKEMESKSMNGKKYENVIDTEAEFKAYMKNYEQEMQKLRLMHQSIVKDKGWTPEVDSLTGEIDAQLALSKQSLSKEEIKTQEIDTKKKDPYFVTQTEQRLSTPTSEVLDALPRNSKTSTPSKGLLIRSQRNYKRAEKNDIQFDKEERPSLTKTTTASFKTTTSRTEVKNLATTSEDFKKRLDKEKENFRKIKSNARTINIKEMMQSKNRFKLINAIQMSRDMKEKDKEEIKDEQY